MSYSKGCICIWHVDILGGMNYKDHDRARQKWNLPFHEREKISLNSTAYLR